MMLRWIAQIKKSAILFRPTFKVCIKKFWLVSCVFNIWNMEGHDLYYQSVFHSYSNILNNLSNFDVPPFLQFPCHNCNLTVVKKTVNFWIVSNRLECCFTKVLELAECDWIIPLNKIIWQLSKWQITFRLKFGFQIFKFFTGRKILRLGSFQSNTL